METHDGDGGTMATAAVRRRRRCGSAGAPGEGWRVAGLGAINILTTVAARHGSARQGGRGRRGGRTVTTGRRAGAADSAVVRWCGGAGAAAGGAAGPHAPRSLQRRR